MAGELPDAIERYMHLPYPMEIYEDDGYWAAEFPDLPGLVAGHETWDGLQDAIEDAKRAYFATAIESGNPIPEPRARQEKFSGRFVVRLPRSVHRQIVGAAEREGMSLNSYVLMAVAKELGRAEERDQHVPGYAADASNVSKPESSSVPAGYTASGAAAGSTRMR